MNMTGHQMKELAKYVSEKGLYIVPESAVGTLVEVAVDGYGSSYPLCQWFDQGGDGLSLECIGKHPKGWLSTWRANILQVFDHAVTIADSPVINAYSIWINPDFTGFSNLQWLLGGGLASMFHMGIGEMVRFDTYEKYCNELRKRFGEGAFYLMNLVTREDCKGRGLGTSIMHTCLEAMDRMGVPAYLETHTQRNVAMYERLGFKLCSDAPIPGTRLPHYAMVRTKQLSSNSEL